MTWQPQAVGSPQGEMPFPSPRDYGATRETPTHDDSESAADTDARPAPGSNAERILVMRELRQSGFNITRTARALKVSRVTFYRMLRRNGLVLRQELVPQSDGANSREKPMLG